MCHGCWLRLRCEFGSDLQQSRADFNVRSLIEWNSGNGAAITLLVRALKGDRCARAWQELAAEFAWRQPALTRLERRKLVFCTPASPQACDHAWLFARALSEIYSVPWLRMFSAFGAQKQKARLSRGERFHRTFFVNPIVDRYPDAHWVLVDDVITSGATAQAAYLALRRPKTFAVWTLANRP